MKQQIRYTGPAVAVAATIVVSLALAQDKPATPKLDPQMEEMMKKAEAFCTPGPAHQALEPLVGDWTAEVKMWMTPDSPPTISKGTAKNTWTLKGRFVQQEFSGEFMGKPFHGISFTGYDNVRQLPGDHELFICGNDAAAKREVTNRLSEWFGWKPGNIIDLGDITNSRGTEMILTLWVRLWGVVGNPHFNIPVVRGKRGDKTPGNRIS